jgi:signal transduction histidine kinase
MRRAAERFAAPAAVEVDAEDERAQRTAIVGQLAGGILHDFNNVLMVITGTIEILAEGVADRPQLAAIARLIDEAATRGARLATHLLAFARGQPSRREAVDLNALLAEAASLLRPTLSGRIDVVVHPLDDVPPVLVDAGLLLAAVLSLGISIRDAMPEGGTLTLRAVPAAETVSIRAQAVAHVGDDARAASHPIELGFVESLVRRFGGDLVLSRSEAGASVEIALPRASDQERRSADS